MPPLYMRYRKRKKEKNLPIPTTREGWKVETRGRQTLVLPLGNAEWTRDRLFFRSAIIDRDGSVLSMGLPKFWTSHRDETRHADLLATDLPVHIFEKLDGSLVIRSVIGDRVVWRTRGSFDLGGLAHRIEDYLKTQDARLMDPAWQKDVSLHFEWTCPINRVVVHYPESSLHLLGGISNTTLQTLSTDEVREISRACNISMPDEITYTGELCDLQAWVDEHFADREGVVVKWGENRLRYKSHAYLLAHKKRFDLNPSVIMNAMTRKRVKSAADCVENLKVYDPELVAWVVEVYTALTKTNEMVEQEFKDLKQRVRSQGNLPERVRKKRWSAELDGVAYNVCERIRRGKSGGREQLMSERRKETLRRLNGDTVYLRD